MNIKEQVIKVCKAHNQDHFSAKEIKDLVEKEFGRNKSSVIPSDYCYNRINKGIAFTTHIFVFTKGKYKFVGTDFLYSGTICADGKKERVVGLWENGKFYLWEDFPLVSKEHPKRTSGEPIGFVELDTHESAFLVKLESSQLDSTTARQARLKIAAKIPAKVAVLTYVYARNPDVVAEALARAKGQCEGCCKPAPFRRRKDGTPYLEVHHKVQLANGGEDTIENAIALCPNCHRYQHFGEYE